MECISLTKPCVCFVALPAFRRLQYGFSLTASDGKLEGKLGNEAMCCGHTDRHLTFPVSANSFTNYSN